MDEIEIANKSAKLKGLDVRKLFPLDLTEFWHYSGSLTSPPCTESVSWLVFKNPIQISSSQVIKKVYYPFKKKIVIFVLT